MFLWGKGEIGATKSPLKIAVATLYKATRVKYVFAHSAVNRRGIQNPAAFNCRGNPRSSVVNCRGIFFIRWNSHLLSLHTIFSSTSIPLPSKPQIQKKKSSNLAPKSFKHKRYQHTFDVKKQVLCILFGWFFVNVMHFYVSYVEPCHGKSW